jgi:hypothetical protein
LELTDEDVGVIPKFIKPYDKGIFPLIFCSYLIEHMNTTFKTNYYKRRATKIMHHAEFYLIVHLWIIK